MASVAIVGVSGYSGLELLRLLANTQGFEVTAAYSDRAAGTRLADLLPAGDPARQRLSDALVVRPQADASSAWKDASFVALATPAEVSAELAPALIAQGARVLDLSGAFRLRDVAVFRRFYKFEHPSPTLLAGVPYGLPQCLRTHAGSIATAKLVANPGCYATAAILSLAPLLEARLIEANGIFIDGKSGVSGAGRKIAESTMFMEVGENVTAYRVANHQHTPEIELALSRAAGNDVEVTFAPHLLPLSRGLMTTSFARLTRAVSSADMLEVFGRAYRNVPGLDGTAQSLPAVEVTSIDRATIHAVARTNVARIGLTVDEEKRTIVVVCALDNLLKGAASQALENLYAMARGSDPDAQRPAS